MEKLFAAQQGKKLHRVIWGEEGCRGERAGVDPEEGTQQHSFVNEKRN